MAAPPGGVPLLTESAGHVYREIEMANGEKIRVTHVTDSREPRWTGLALRIQIVETNGHLRQGSEIPADQVGDLLKALHELAL